MSNEANNQSGHRPVHPVGDASAQRSGMQGDASRMAAADTVANRSAMGAAEELAALLDQYLADLEAGRKPVS